MHTVVMAFITIHEKDHDDQDDRDDNDHYPDQPA